MMHKFFSNGSELFYHDQGTGEPIIFLHGFPLDHTMWQPHLDNLAQHYRVIAPDLRGLGMSLSTATVVSMQDHAHDVAGLVAHLNITEPVNVVGLSMGGYVLWQLQALYPKLIKRAVLCDTKITADSPEAQAVRKSTAQKVLIEGTAFLTETMLPRLLHPETIIHRPQIKQAICDMILKAPPAGVASASLGMADRPDMSHLLDEFHHPTLVICGAGDIITPPAEMQEMSRKMPAATFQIIPQAGHMSPMEQPAIFQQYLREFLTAT